MIKYTVKAIDCGEFSQYYIYHTVKFKNLDHDGLLKGGGYSRKEESVTAYKNLVRAKNNMARLVMTNYSKFKTFITLTFSENLTDQKKANSIFNDWVSNLRKRVKTDFTYIAVPEFQKRGAVHYHVLTNIDYNDFSVLCKEEVKLYSPTSNDWQIGRSVMSWKKGYSMAKDITSENYDIIGYMSKYMLKDFDNRTFGTQKYLRSRVGLDLPVEKFLDFNNFEELEEFNRLLYNSNIRYKGEYKDLLTGRTVDFVETKGFQYDANSEIIS